MGIEPTRPAWKAGTLPLSYTRFSVTHSTAVACGCLATPLGRKLQWRKKDSNLRRQSHQIYSLAPLAAWVFLQIVASVQSGLPSAFRVKKHGNPQPDKKLPRMAVDRSVEELAVGFEPTTSGLQNRSSAVELR